jgi:hypothetical protein
LHAETGFENRYAQTAISAFTDEKAGENRSSVFEWMKRSDYLVLVLILAVRLN